MSKNKKANEEKNKGNDYFNKGNYAEAIKHYTNAIKHDPKESTFYSNRCIAYLKLNNTKQALEDAEATIKYNPTWPKGYLRKASVLVALDKYEEAQTVLTRGINQKGDIAELQKKLEEVNHELKKRQNKSREEAKRPKTTDESGKPLSPALIAKEEGNFHYKESRYEQAAQCYTRAIEITSDPNEKAMFYSNRAACYQQLQRYTDTITDCTCCLEIQPENVKALLRRGLAYENNENYKLARQDMQQALSLDPNAKMASEALVRLERVIKQLQKFS
jgi:stress-induced-phosphoprotein 1